MSPSFTTLPGLDPSITCRLVPVNDLDFFVLEALPSSRSESSAKPPLLVLLHGFPEIAYSWRKVMVPLAARGFAVIAPDLRGYGQTRERGGQVRQVTYDEDLTPYQMVNHVADVVALVYTLGYDSVHAVIGHDFGSPVAAHCALLRPDLFKRVVMMSAPFTGAVALETIANPGAPTLLQRLNQALAALDPPRKHYMMYNSTPEANSDYMNPQQDFDTFLRAYFRTKSANGEVKPLTPLAAFNAEAIAGLPHYYIMPRDQTMPEVTRRLVASYTNADTSEEWLSAEDLAIYVDIYKQTGFQGGLNMYRCNAADPDRWNHSLHAFVGKQIEVPAMFIAGAQDWGTYQVPGAAQSMRTKACKDMRDEDFVLVSGAGHWVQQEQPEKVVETLTRFITRDNPHES